MSRSWAHSRCFATCVRPGVDESLVLSALSSMSTTRALPFRFLAAARYAPQ